MCLGCPWLRAMWIINGTFSYKLFLGIVGLSSPMAKGKCNSFNCL